MSFSISLIQNTPFLSKSKNIVEVLNIINQNKNTDLIIFPELSLNGYILQDGVFDEFFIIDEIKSLFKNTKNDIVLSCVLKENNKIYNSSIYLSDGKVVHTHHKNNLPNHTLFQESRFFSKGNEILSFDTKFGKIAVLICEDLWDSNSINKVCNLNTDIIIIQSASPSRGFGENLEIKEKWDALLKATSILSSSYIFFTNRVGFEDGLGFWGGSKVLSPEGQILKEGKLFDDYILNFDIDIKNDSKLLFCKYLD
jgi:predicted amidohydrolase